MTQLFRREAVEHQRQRFHGAAVITHHPWRTLVALSMLVLAGAFMVFVATQGFARRETVTGLLTPEGGPLRVVAPHSGLVVYLVARGGRVDAQGLVARLAPAAACAAVALSESVPQTRILAPRPGEVSMLLVEPGQVVVAGQTLAKLLPSDAVLEAELYVPVSAVSLIQVGMPLRLHADGAPGGLVEGRVVAIEQTAVTRGELSPERAAVVPPRQDRVYRARVALMLPALSAGALQPGMRVQVYLVAQWRTLLAWALKPLETPRTVAP